MEALQPTPPAVRRRNRLERWRKPTAVDFEKYQSNGNDFVLIDEDRVPGITEEARKSLSRVLLDRNRSVGADSLLFVKRERSGIRYRVYEEGLELEMCGNGLCCAAHYALATGASEPLMFVTKGDVRRSVEAGRGLYTADLGSLRPIGAYLGRGNEGSSLMVGVASLLPGGRPAAVLGRMGVRIERGYFVNPSEAHVVFLVEDIMAVDLARVGDFLCGLTRVFPESTNVNLCQRVDDRAVRIRTYERGKFKETLACGTGSAASAYVFKSVFGLRARTLKVHNRGGDVTIRFLGEKVFLTGPAVRVFHGTVRTAPPPPRG